MVPEPAPIAFRGKNPYASVFLRLNISSVWELLIEKQQLKISEKGIGSVTKSFPEEIAFKSTIHKDTEVIWK